MINLGSLLTERHAPCKAASIVPIVTGLMLLTGFCLLFVNLYSLNKGLSLWDESYYLLSYKMAGQHFYSHFNNTPFLVAYLFERFNPGLIGYRVIHMALNLISSTVFTLAVIRFYKITGNEINGLSKLLLLSIAFFMTMYVYQIANATLGYNHLNEFFILLSESFVLLALTAENTRYRFVLLLLAGSMLSLDVYIKPPTFVSILISEILFLMCVTRDKKTGIICNAILLTGCVISFLFSLACFYPLAQWEQYLSFIHAQQAHSPLKVLTIFLVSGLGMLKSISSLIVSGMLAVVAMVVIATSSTRNLYIKYVQYSVTAIVLISNLYFALHFFFPPDIWQSFEIHWWYWSVHSANTLIFISLVNFILALSICLRDGWQTTKSIIYLLMLLAINPIVLSVGTLNGFGQVQIYALSWLLMSGLALILSVRISSIFASVYSVCLILVFMVIALVYFYRQEMPFNIGGRGALSEQTYRLRDFPLLKNVYTDKRTYDLLVQTKAILDKYPDYPTLTFFDMPGLQYVFGRQWVVPDPWLSNLEHPLTKDDDYNCKAITGKTSQLKNTLFIVAHEKNIDAKLSNCLDGIGFPKKMKLIGTVETNVANMQEPIKIYLDEDVQT